MTHAFRDVVLRQLEEHGLRPVGTTDPVLIRDFLSDLYRYEIRRLKARLLAGEFAKASYLDRVVELRRRYPLLSVPLQHWLEPGNQDPGDSPRP